MARGRKEEAGIPVSFIEVQITIDYGAVGGQREHFLSLAFSLVENVFIDVFLEPARVVRELADPPDDGTSTGTTARFGRRPGN